MKRSFRLFALALLLFLLPLYAAAQEDPISIITSAPWSEPVAGSNVYTFSADGTGKMDLGNNFVLDTTWTLEGDQLTFHYNLYGERMLICTLTQADGVYRLTYGEGSFLVRESDAQALIAAGRSDLNAYAVAAGEQIRLGFTDITFDDAMSSRKVIGSSNSGIVLTDKPGYTYLTVLGTIKNGTGGEIKTRSLHAEVTLDGANTYGASVAAEMGGQLSYDMPAQNAGTLYISVQLPVDVLDSFQSATVYLSFNDNFASAPATLADGSYVFSFDLTDELIAAAKRGPKRTMVYFDECPVLPTPVSFTDVRDAGRGSSSVNGKTTRIDYRFSRQYNDDNLSDLAAAYKNALAAMGFTVKGDDIYAGKTKVASLSVDATQIKVNLALGNEKLKFTPVAPTEAQPVVEEEIPEEVVYVLGQTLKLDTMEMKLDKTAVGDIYSSITPRSRGFYQYFEGTDGNEIFALSTTFKNISGEPVDIRNIYGEFTFDGKYTYRGEVTGAKKDADWFIDDVAPMETVTCYVYAQVPKSVLSSYSSCTARIGFTDNYGIKYSSSGGLLNFDYCDDVFTVDLSKGAKASSAKKDAGETASSGQYETLKPGSKGQAVLDARMKLYELGYFRNKPTQTEYTNNMKDYVKKFERDFGLKQDGILSPEDQEVLFAQ